MNEKFINIKEMGRYIKHYRLQKALTQEKLADRTGLSLQYIGNIERGATTSSMETIIKICYALDITPNQLFIPTSKLSRAAHIQQISEMLENRSDNEIRHIIKYIEFIQNSNLF